MVVAKWALILVLPSIVYIKKISYLKLRQLGVSGPILSSLAEFLSTRLEKVVVDSHSNEYRNVILGVPQGSVLGPLLSILHKHDMWFGLENMLVSYADDTTPLVYSISKYEILCH